MAFTPEFIDQVRQASDIVQVVQQWVPLKKAGANWKGLCPFHQEKSPSFNVHPAKQIYHCFGCGEGGDVFAFVQKVQKTGFGEAIKQLAERAGIALPEEGADDVGREAAAERKRRDEAQVRLLELASVWFRRNLEESAEGKAARDYADQRGLDLATRERFGLGYAPSDGRLLLSASEKKGYNAADLLDAGFAVKNERGTYSRFRGRLMFPIHDPKGRLVGFGGRILGPGEPKYLNSPETPLFSKGRLLYPWVQAKEALGKRREALVCEGYMDAIACHQAGLEQAVASLGTALTEEHAKLLKRYVDRVLLVFDADAAGLRAARRAGEPLLGAGLDVRVARLQGAKDPDELLRRDGPDALRRALEEAQPLVDFCVQVGLAAAGEKPSPAQRAAALADVFPLLIRLPSASELDAALKAAAQAVGVGGEAAAADLAAFRRGEQRNAPAAPAAAKASQGPVALPAAQSLVLVEREILNLLVVHPPLVAQAKLDLGEAPSMAAPDLQAAAELLWKAPAGVVMALPDDGSESYKLGDALLSRLSHGSLPQLAPPEESLHDLILRRQELLLEHEVAVRTLALRQAEGDPAAEAELLKQMQAFKQAIQGLRRERRERPLARPEENA